DWKFQSPPGHKEVVASDYADSQSSFPDGFLATSELQVEAIGYNTNQALSGSKMLENISIYNVEPGAPIQESVSVEQAIDHDKLHGELVDVQSRSMISRAQVFETSLGNFEWRYGSREERRACNADSLLILERMDCIVLADGAKTKSSARVAQLIRNDQFRTPGSGRYSGGNGGRLVMDLRTWKDEKHTDADGVEAFFVASCILMLKREADRFIENNIAAVT
ncbi:unnamed protein product, partial [Penicillium pancosmium]